MTRRAAWLGALALAWTAALAGAAPPAGAQAATQQGWWTVANPGGPVPAPAPPDVPADGLLLQGGSSDSSPTAYAALVYELADGATAGELKLHVTSGSGTTPSATPRACLLSGAFSAAQGGPMASAPAYDCSKKVTGKPSSSGDTFAFDVSGLVTDRILAIAILPASATDRVVFDKPAADSLAVTQPVAADATAGSPDAGSAVLDSGSGSFATSPSVDTSAGLPADLSQSSLPAAESAAASPAASVPQVAAASPAGSATPAAAAAPATSGGSGNQSAPAVIALGVAGVLLAAALWAYAGSSAQSSLPT